MTSCATVSRSVHYVSVRGSTRYRHYTSALAAARRAGGQGSATRGRAGQRNARAGRAALRAGGQGNLTRGQAVQRDVLAGRAARRTGRQGSATHGRAGQRNKQAGREARRRRQGSTTRRAEQREGIIWAAQRAGQGTTGQQGTRACAGSGAEALEARGSGANLT
ncbi:unnamed protein product [Closterium sp. NIES-64]|nr:unnamed protein product [Closterium sp. NIES-64]